MFICTIAAELVHPLSVISLQLALSAGMAIQTGFAYLVRDDVLYTLTVMSPVLLIAIAAV